MARKNHKIISLRPAAQIAAMNLQSIMSHISMLRLPPRLKKPAPQLRQIPVVMFGGSPEPVKIRHVHPNVGSAINEIQPTQSPLP